MPTRLTVALAVGALACAALAACTEAAPEAGPATPSQYVSAVDALLNPAARLASSLSQHRGTATDPPVPSEDRLHRLIVLAHERLDDLRALRLEDAALRAQRDRLAGAYERMLPQMERAADALARNDQAAITAASAPFLDSLTRLPSAVSSSSR
jgi:hypothetical protein